MGDLLSGGQESGFRDLQKSLGQGIGEERGALQQGEGMLQPFQAGGSQALSSLLSQLGQGGDSQGLIDRIQGAFKQTPAQQFEQKQATGAAQNLLQSQGIAGSGPGAQALAQTVSGITGQQEQQNLQNVLGLRQQTLGSLLSAAGLGAGAAGQGAQLAGTTGQSIAQLLGQQGQAKFGGDVAGASGINQLISGGLGLAGLL